MSLARVPDEGTYTVDVVTKAAQEICGRLKYQTEADRVGIVQAALIGIEHGWTTERKVRASLTNGTLKLFERALELQAAA